MAGTLYVVTTPIGNLQDLTPRAAKTLALVDFVAAEDTRVTVRLLNYLELKKPMVSYYEHNERERMHSILSRLQAGESCALCTDAGVPAISDPGEILVREAQELGIPVVPVPGASAAITALCVSGQATARFVFEGFLPMNLRQRKERLSVLAQEQRTLIFYEAPHKLLRTLKDLCDAFGAQRSITLCRELTKLHEEIIKTTLGQAGVLYAEQPPRGEFVLVVEGAKAPVQEQISLEDAVRIACNLLEAEALSSSEAARRAAAQTGLPRNQIYKGLINHNKE